MKPFYAVIIPLGGEADPPQIWGPGDPRPQPPIANAPGIPGYNPQPPRPWDPNFPTPPIPIYPGGTPNPPGTWGPNSPIIGNPISGIPGIPGYEPPRPPLDFWGPRPGFPTNPISGIPGLPGYEPGKPSTPPEGFPPVPTNPISGIPGPHPPTDEPGWMLVYFPDGNYYQWVKVDDVVKSMKGA